MKNKVLRLAIVAVLVVAMVLSMAACDPKDPEPTTPTTPTTTTTTTTPPTTTTTTPTTPASSDEAALAAKYGFTFPADASQLTFDGNDLVAKFADGTDAKYGIKKDPHNKGYQYSKDLLTISAKISGVTFEGEKVTDGAIAVDTTDFNALSSKITFSQAGVYTVEYTFNFQAGEYKSGIFTTNIAKEQYKITKTYTVNKADVKISVGDLAYPKSPKAIDFATKAVVKANDAVLDTALLAVIAGLDSTFAKGDYDISASILKTDLTKTGSYPMPLVIKNKGKDTVYATSDVVARNFNFTFTDGTCYVLTEEEIAAARNAADALELAVEGAAPSTEEIKLASSRYDALSAGGKVAIDSFQGTGDEIIGGIIGKSTNAATVDELEEKIYDLGRTDLVTEAKALYKAWLDSLKNKAQEEAFITYMLALDTDKTEDDYDSDYDFVETALVAKYGAIDETGTLYETGYVPLDEVYLNSLMTEFERVEDLYDGEYSALKNATSVNAEAITDYNKSFSDMKKAYETLHAKQLTAGIKDKMVDDTANNEEINAKYDAVLSLIDGLDAYLGSNKETSLKMEALTGYNFASVVSGRKFAAQNGAKDAFSVISQAQMYFLDDITAYYKRYVDAWVALDASIVAAQSKVLETLGSNLSDAVKRYSETTGTGGSTSTTNYDLTFDGTKFTKAVVGAATDDYETKLEAIQAYIADTLIADMTGTGTEPDFAPVFTGSSPKALDEVIGKAVADLEKALAGTLKDYTAIVVD